MTLLQLRATVRLVVEFEDRTRFGSPVTARPDDAVREVFGILLEYAQNHGDAALLREAPRLLQQVVDGEIFNVITQPNGAGFWQIKPEILFPDPAAARPVAISFVSDDTGRHVRAALPLSYWPQVHELVSALSGAGCDPARLALGPDLSTMVEALQREDLVEAAQAAADPPDSGLAGNNVTFLGHNTVVVRSRSSRVIVDPFLFAAGSAYPASYQPLQLRDVGPVDAVLITHSHPDHFDPASLLRFPPETRMIVPRVDRETILAVAMESRLHELGFANVQVLDWGATALVGDIEVHALPFYGEQPTDCDVLHPPRSATPATPIWCVRRPFRRSSWRTRAATFRVTCASLPCARAPASARSMSSSRATAAG
jgi:hypothetical protein